MRLRSGRLYAAPQPPPRRAIPRQSRKSGSDSGKKTPPGSESGRRGSESSKPGNGSRRSSKSSSRKRQDTVLGSRVSKRWPEDVRYIRPRGFRNIGGATCYRNSMMQSLLHVPVFCNYLGQMHQDTSHAEDKCVACALQFLSYSYWHDRDSATVFPQAWIRGLYKALAAAVEERDDHFFEQFVSVLVQGDPVEFWDAIKEQLLAMENDGEVSIAELLKTDWTVSTECRGCGYKDTRQSETQSIAVAITTDDGLFNGQTLVEDLEDYQKAVNEVRCICVDTAAQLGEDIGNQIRDEISTIKNSPEILIVQLKRFSYDMLTRTSSKVSGGVDFDEELDLTNFTDKQRKLKYLVHGIVLHHGDTVEEGHYIAAVRRPDSETFYLVDDSTVSGPQSLAHVLAQEAKRGFEPYVLLYQKIEARVVAEEVAENEDAEAVSEA
ncbi:hypothetical protein LTR86_000388 [Recurvomyces mirabilis]|nr:hypothetical protein LTR86_000388 [Recurvomyces mirabilis]